MSIEAPTVKCPGDESQRTPLESENQFQREIHCLVAERDASHRLIDAMTHESRTPLTVIQEYCSMVRDGLAGPVTGEQREYLEIAMGRANDLGRLLNDFSETAGLGAGTRRLRPRSVQLADVADHVESAMLARAAAGRVRMKFRVPRDLPNVFCDAEAIGRAISNVACHAMRTAEEEGMVRIWAEAAPDRQQVVVVVENLPHGDRGDCFGLPPDLSENIPAADSSTLMPNTLGMATAQTLVRASLSELCAQRNADRGTTYFFRLPEADPETVLASHFRHRKASSAGLDAAAIILVSLDADAGNSTADSLDELLFDAVDGGDLVFRLEPNVWMLAADATNVEPAITVERVHNAWIESFGRSAKQPPEIRVEIKAMYHFPSQNDEHPMATDEPLFPVAPRETKKSCILLVDDDRSIVDALRIRLTLSGYEVLTAHDGRQGLTAATDHRPNLILLDIRMPVMDGLTMLARMHDNEATQHIPVIVVSASHDDRQRALELGAYFFVEKPYDPNVLKITIASILRSPESRKSQVARRRVDAPASVA